MATFKVGQRVRIVGAGSYSRTVDLYMTYVLRLPSVEATGCEGVIVARWRGAGDRWLHWDVWVPALRDNVLCDSSSLRPLDDPKADAFLARIKNLKPYEEPTVKPHKVTSATFNGMTLVCTADGVWSYGPDGWQRVQPSPR